MANPMCLPVSIEWHPSNEMPLSAERGGESDTLIRHIEPLESICRPCMHSRITWLVALSHVFHGLLDEIGRFHVAGSQGNRDAAKMQDGVCGGVARWRPAGAAAAYCMPPPPRPSNLMLNASRIRRSVRPVSPDDNLVCSLIFVILLGRHPLLLLHVMRTAACNTGWTILLPFSSFSPLSLSFSYSFPLTP